jgi:hypothetical protein
MVVLRTYVGGNYMRHYNSALSQIFKTVPWVGIQKRQNHIRM